MNAMSPRSAAGHLHRGTDALLDVIDAAGLSRMIVPARSGTISAC